MESDLERQAEAKSQRTLLATLSNTDFVQSKIRIHGKGRNKRSDAEFRKITRAAKSQMNCREGKSARSLF